MAVGVQEREFTPQRRVRKRIGASGGRQENPRAREGPRKGSKRIWEEGSRALEWGGRLGTMRAGASEQVWAPGRC